MSDARGPEGGDTDPAFDADDITAGLHSGDPDRVRQALAVLDLAWRRHRLIPLPMPDAECLDAFGDEVPSEVLDQFLTVVENYPVFEPSPEPNGRHITRVEAVLQHGRAGSQPVFEVALSIRIDDSAGYVVADLMRYLEDLPIKTDAEQKVVEQLLDHLLDGNTTHDAVVDGLSRWAFVGCYPKLVDRLLLQLNDDERLRIAVARD